MQLGGIESGHGHGTGSHRVTNCIHTHSHNDKGGGGGAAAGAVRASQVMEQAETLDAQLTLTGWLEKMFGSGKRLLGSLWGSDTGTAGQSDGRTGAKQTAAPINEAVVTAGAGRSPAGQENRLPDNPYFSAVEKPDGQPGSLRRRVKERLKSVTERFTGRFSSAQTKGSFQSRKGNQREDLRRRSKFRKDELEIDCVLTDDSYLLDSYDRKGGYSKLSAEK